jgi:guanylate kinase
MSKLFVISAPSGAGKTTLCQRMLQTFPELVLSISSTTRRPRGQEQNGKEYFFISAEEFQEKVRKKRFAEWALVHGNYYGTSLDQIDQVFSRGQSIVLDIDVQGADSLKKAYPGRTCLIFIAPPSMQELEFRLRARATDSEETIQKRLTNAREEMARSSDFDYVIVNDSLARASKELEDIVRKELANG